MPSFGIQCLLTVTVTLLGAGLFSVVFNLCNELQYGIWASTCLLPFVFPLLYTQTVNSYFDIPIEIYKVWKYSEEYDSDTLRINRKRSIVMDVEIFRKVDDPASERITGKASEDVIFGQWFQRMIDDCNLKSPSSPIVYKNVSIPVPPRNCSATCQTCSMTRPMPSMPFQASSYRHLPPRWSN
jgi:hypothetical protein